MAENPSKQKSFEELTDIYQRFKLQSKTGNKIEEYKFAPVIKYVSDMCEELNEDNIELKLRLTTIKASLLFDESRILLSKQNISIALVKLRRALNLVCANKLNPKITYLYFRILNQLAYFLTKNDELNEALELLESAEQLYETLTNISDIVIFDTEDLFQEICPHKKRNATKFEKLISNNFHLQGWIYNRQHLTEKFIVYHHMVLKRQLETQDGSALSWVFKCARLASYFFGIHKFSEARYHLAASCHVLREYELDLLKHRSETHFVGEWTNLQKYYADIGKYWVKYGLFLFEASRQTTPNDSLINNILIKSFKDAPSRKPLQTDIGKSSKEKLETIDEKPEDINEVSQHMEPPKNNDESLSGCVSEENCISTGLDKFNIMLKTKEEDICKNEPIEINANEPNDVANKTCTNEKGDTQSTLNEDVAEITRSIIDTIDDQLNDKDDNRKSCVAKYVSMLDNLAASANKINTTSSIPSADAIIETNVQEKEIISDDAANEKINYKFVFPSLSLQDFESKVSNKFITTLDGARALFLFTQEWLKRSKAYYSIQDYPLDYVNLILDLNELYRYLIYYETTVDMQYDVQKRRVDLLEKLSTILKEYRPQFYLTLNIELVNELTQAQIELVLLNLRRLNSAESETAQQLTAKESFQQKDDAHRKMEALMDIRKRLTRKESGASFGAPKMSFIEMQQSPRIT